MGLPPKICVTADIIVFSILRGGLHVLLIRRANPPFQGKWALPGGFIEEEETLEQSALRELKEETGIEDVYLEQLYTFGDPGRDPRGRTVSVAYFALVNADRVTVRAGDDAGDAQWHRVDRLPPLAFDHRRMIEMALARLRAKLGYSTVGSQLLPEKFTLSELQRMYEVILGRALDKRNFRKKILSLGLLRARAKGEKVGRYRPAQLYSFKAKEVMIVDGLVR
jgi:8-oxo-dGTP diphosphatase